MNHFKGKQFKKDVIIALLVTTCVNLNYREVQELLYDRGINVCHTTFIAGFKNTVKFSTIYGKRKIDRPSIRGKWTKLISRLRDVGTIFIGQSMRTDSL